MILPFAASGAPLASHEKWYTIFIKAALRGFVNRAANGEGICSFSILPGGARW